MENTLRGQLATLGDEIRATGISEGGKQTATWCIGQLPALYVQLRQTHESRYGDEIIRLVQSVLKELVSGKKTCPAAQQLAVRVVGRFQLFHEQFGLPALGIHSPGMSPARTRKVG